MAAMFDSRALAQDPAPAWHGVAELEPGSFLASLRPEAHHALFHLGRRRVFRHGAPLLTQGHTPHWVMVLLRGRVKVAHHSDDGREVVLNIWGPGDLLGVVPSLDGEPADATIIAVDDVEAQVLSTVRFEAFLQSHPEAQRVLLQVLIRRLRRATRDRTQLALNDTFGRVALRLVELADRYGERDDGRIRITLPLSQNELAAWTGTSREATSKALQLMRQRGYIETFRREIHVLDIASLRRRVAGVLGS